MPNLLVQRRVGLLQHRVEELHQERDHADEHEDLEEAGAGAAAARRCTSAHEIMPVMTITSVKVMPMPIAVSRFFETPKKMHSPR